MQNPIILLLSSSFLLSASGQEYMETYEEEEPAPRVFASIASPVTFPDGDDWDYSAGIEDTKFEGFTVRIGAEF